MTPIVLHIAESDAGASVSAALKRALADSSWNDVKRAIAGRRVQVNGNLCVDEGRRLSAGDVVKLVATPLAPPVTARDIQLVHVDPHVVVVDKPAGVTTLRHPQERDWSSKRKELAPTLDEWIARLLADESSSRRPAPNDRRRRGRERVETPAVFAVHRLDRDTSGLMVFARTREAETLLVRQFKKHTVSRRYVAVCHGDPGEATIETWLARDRGDGLRGSVAKSPETKDDGLERAVTHVRTLERLGNCAAVECRLETGRTHQIRIHLSERGCILCGEKTYTHPVGGRPFEDASGATRQALHAVELGFDHPATGRRVEHLSPLPQDMRDLIARLRDRAKRS